MLYYLLFDTELSYFDYPNYIFTLLKNTDPIKASHDHIHPLPFQESPIQESIEVGPIQMSLTATSNRRVAIHDYGVVADNVDLFHWPDGEFLQLIVEKHSCSNATTTSSSAECLQVGARRALLQTFFPLLLIRNDVSTDPPQKDAQNEVQQVWNDLVVQTMRDGNKMAPNNKANNNDLMEFLQYRRSCGKQLHWSVLECQAGCQFRLHAHPNLELVYCIRGALHEMRRQESKHHYYAFASLIAGDWLVNTAGSVHKSFTASNQECILLALWSGAHADIPEISAVTAAVERADASLLLVECSAADGCAAAGAATDTLDVTFLPESEREQKK